MVDEMSAIADGTLSIDLVKNKVVAVPVRMETDIETVSEAKSVVSPSTQTSETQLIGPEMPIEEIGNAASFFIGILVRITEVNISALLELHASWPKHSIASRIIRSKFE